MLGFSSEKGGQKKTSYLEMHPKTVAFFRTRDGRTRSFLPPVGTTHLPAHCTPRPTPKAGELPPRVGDMPYYSRTYYAYATCALTERLEAFRGQSLVLELRMIPAFSPGRQHCQLGALKRRARVTGVCAGGHTFCQTRAVQTFTVRRSGFDTF